MSKNASGLKAEECKNLKERSTKPHEESVIAALKEMYTCSPNEDTFSVYASDAVFHDPIGIATGPKTIQAQFIALAKLFPRADIPKFRVLENPQAVPHNVILIDQDVSYYRNPESTPTKTLNSLVTITLNGDNKIQNHVEEWNHQKNTSSEDGFLGMLNEARKKFTANLTEKLVGAKQ
ncbi:hypothetical protein Agabi119p4_302 [Agaricus bisporus var. burnettii]|uniref:Uncharacterized protein n=1 Tax=Agaricus bisporus var. burnettii TaxID=192524 RepID=A0A8H7KKY3_AGABI|nr:hypothetical protein Agabi119p4_302 [Agaricus bisporus var. burnettii]